MATPRTKPQNPQQPMRHVNHQPAPRRQAITHRQAKQQAKQARHAQTLAEQTGADFLIGWCARVELGVRQRAAARQAARQAAQAQAQVSAQVKGAAAHGA